MPNISNLIDRISEKISNNASDIATNRDTIGTNANNIKNVLDISKGHLSLSGGNLTGPLTINNQKVATEDFVTESINNIDLGGLAESISRKLDIEGASSVGMPSDRYIDLSPSVTEFTAIDNGYTMIEGASKSASLAFIYVITSDSCKSKNSANIGEGMMLTLPVRKGTQVYINTNGNVNMLRVRFIYAEGAK